MTLEEYQKLIDEVVQPYAKPYWHPLSQLARISEEVGEVSRIINHHYGDKPKKQGEVHAKLEDELADILFSVLTLANSQDIVLDEPLKRAINKLQTRDSERFAKKADVE